MERTRSSAAQPATTGAAADPRPIGDERFRLLVESLPDCAVFLLDRDGVIRTCNPAAEILYGYPGGTFFSRPFSFLQANAPGDSASASEMFAHASAHGSFRTEDWHRRKDGTEFWADLLVTALHGSDQTEIGFAAVVRDDTERKRAVDALRQVNASLEQRVDERTRELARLSKDLEAFIYSVAHDLRAPLRGVMGYLEALHDDHAAELTAPALGFLDRSLYCARKTQTLVDELLKLSRLDRQEMHRGPTPLKAVVAEVIDTFYNETKTRTIEWRVGELPTVDCDPTLIRQVFAHLLSNALKFTRSRPQALIEIQQETRNAENVIVVRDNGVGFDPRQATKLFTPFFRAHAAPEFEGTGIGLSIADRIVRRHGGRIWAEAQPGEGATFCFTLEARR